MGLKRAKWLRLAAYAGLPGRIATRVLDAQAAAAGKFARLIQASYLPGAMKAAYLETVRGRMAASGMAYLSVRYSKVWRVSPGVSDRFDVEST